MLPYKRLGKSAATRVRERSLAAMRLAGPPNCHPGGSRTLGFPPAQPLTFLPARRQLAKLAAVLARSVLFSRPTEWGMQRAREGGWRPRFSEGQTRWCACMRQPRCISAHPQIRAARAAVALPQSSQSGQAGLPNWDHCWQAGPGTAGFKPPICCGKRRERRRAAHPEYAVPSPRPVLPASTGATVRTRKAARRRRRERGELMVEAKAGWEAGGSGAAAAAGAS